MPEEPAYYSEPAGKSRKSGCSLVLVVLILCATALVWKTSDDILAFFKPAIEDVTITRTEGGQEILELNTYEKLVNATKHVEKTKWLSTWEIDYSQQFKAKYGMRVTKREDAILGFCLRYDIIVTSLEPIGAPIIKSNDGFWNKIDDMDRAAIINAVKEQARDQAMHDNAAVQIAEQRLRAYLEKRYADKNPTFQRG